MKKKRKRFTRNLWGSLLLSCFILLCCGFCSACMTSSCSQPAPSPSQPTPGKINNSKKVNNLYRLISSIWRLYNLLVCCSLGNNALNGGKKKGKKSLDHGRYHGGVSNVTDKSFVGVNFRLFLFRARSSLMSNQSSQHIKINRFSGELY